MVVAVRLAGSWLSLKTAVELVLDRDMPDEMDASPRGEPAPARRPSRQWASEFELFSYYRS